MELVKILKPDFVFEDERGIISQITHETFGQINAVFTKKGALRGNFHYHATTEEVFFIISGETEVSLYLGEISEKHIFKTGDMFLIPKQVRHSFAFLQDTYLVGLYTARVELENGSKDILCD